MSVLLSWTNSDGTTGSFVPDISAEETYTFSATVATHYVESGSDVTDHIRPGLNKISMELVASNTPLIVPTTQAPGVTGAVQTVQGQGGVSFKAFQFSTGFDRVKDAFGDLASAIQNAAIFSITTARIDVRNYACTGFVENRKPSNGGALRAQLEFTELHIVSSTEADAIPATIKKKSKGSKPSKPISDTDPKDAQKRSLLAAGRNALSGLLSGSN